MRRCGILFNQATKTVKLSLSYLRFFGPADVQHDTPIQMKFDLEEHRMWAHSTLPNFPLVTEGSRYESPIPFLVKFGVSGLYIGDMMQWST